MKLAKIVSLNNDDKIFETKQRQTTTKTKIRQRQRQQKQRRRQFENNLNIVATKSWLNLKSHQKEYSYIAL